MKKKTIKLPNGEKIKVNLFTEEDLKDKLAMDERDIDTVLEFQSKFPMLMQEEDNDNKFLVDARLLHEQLGYKTEFKVWFNRKKDDLKAIENVDFIKIKLQKSNFITKAGRPELDYRLTLRSAKLFSGSNNLVLTYLVIMEETIKNILQWQSTRISQKKTYKDMCKELHDEYVNKKGKEPNHFVYSNEANMINKLCFGHTSKNIKKMFEYDDNELIRDRFKDMYNDMINDLQDYNIELIIDNKSYEDRKQLLQKRIDRKYTNTIKDINDRFNLNS